MSEPGPGEQEPTPKVGDFDGDGKLDAAVVIPRPGQTRQSEFDLTVLSLHDGAIRWSRRFQSYGPFFEAPSVAVGMVAPSEPASIFVSESPGTNTSNELIVHALDSREGAERWTWRSGVGEGDRKVDGGIDAIALDHDWKDSVCITYSDLKRECRIVIVDSRGKERAAKSASSRDRPEDDIYSRRRLHDRSRQRWP